MTNQPFVLAIDMIRMEMERAAVAGINEHRPMVTILLPSPVGEARFYDHLRHNLGASFFMCDQRTNLMRPGIQLQVAGIDVRLTCPQRIEDLIRRNFT